MKCFAFVFLIAMTGCAADQKPLASENSAPPPAAQNSTPVSASNSAPQDFDGSLPPKVREALENAEEIEIWTFVEDLEYPTAIGEFTIGSIQINANKLTKVARGENRTGLLAAFYEDVRTGGAEAACFKPHHTLIVDYQGEKFALAICYRCGNFVGEVSKEGFRRKPGGKKIDGKSNLKVEKFRGTIPNIETSKSLPIFNKITETN